MPALLLMTVRSLMPRRWSAVIRFSGIPQRPKPPIMMVAPSGIWATASSALATTLFIDPFYFAAGPHPRRLPPLAYARGAVLWRLSAQSTLGLAARTGAVARRVRASQRLKAVAGTCRTRLSPPPVVHASDAGRSAALRA